MLTRELQGWIWYEHCNPGFADDFFPMGHIYIYLTWGIDEGNMLFFGGGPDGPDSQIQKDGQNDQFVQLNYREMDPESFWIILFDWFKATKTHVNIGTVFWFKDSRECLRSLEGVCLETMDLFN